MALFTPSEGKNKRGKRQNKRGKTRNFLIFFVKILVKRARKNGQSEGDSVCVHSIKRENQASKKKATIKLIIITLQASPILFRITFRSLIRSLSVTVIFGHFRFRGANLPLLYNINIYLYILQNQMTESFLKMTENDRDRK